MLQGGRGGNPNSSARATENKGARGEGCLLTWRPLTLPLSLFLSHSITLFCSLIRGLSAHIELAIDRLWSDFDTQLFEIILLKETRTIPRSATVRVSFRWRGDLCSPCSQCLGVITLVHHVLNVGTLCLLELPDGQPTFPPDPQRAGRQPAVWKWERRTVRFIFCATATLSGLQPLWRSTHTHTRAHIHTATHAHIHTHTHKMFWCWGKGDGCKWAALARRH